VSYLELALQMTLIMATATTTVMSMAVATTAMSMATTTLVDLLQQQLLLPQASQHWPLPWSCMKPMCCNFPCIGSSTVWVF